MSAYNAGCNGQGLYYYKGLVDLILNKQAPAIVILNIDAGVVQDSARYLNRATTLAPFMGESKIIQSMIFSKGPLERLKYMSLSYRFNGKPLAIVKNLFVEDRSIAGYEPKNARLQPEQAIERELTSNTPDKKMLDVLREIILQLKNAGVHVILVNSPRWLKEGTIAPYRRPILEEIRNLAQSEQVSFLAVTQENTPLFQDSSYFFDTSHLNEDGAGVFSEILAEKIAGLMENRFKAVYDEL
jgi:hypothetical protein